jgi:Ca-activated chloride channel family protein
MSFAYPFVLWLLIPLIAYFALFRPRRITLFADGTVAVLLLFALALPYRDAAPVQEAIQAREIIFALDVSRSMRARDLSPDRYRYAKEVIRRVVHTQTTDATGLIAFTTNALLLAPPTTDHALVSDALDALEPDNILTKGTSLRKLFAFLSRLEEGERILVLLSDGGEERNLEALVSALPPSTRLVIVPIATPSGAPVPLENDTLLKDERGNLVISRRNPILKTLAEHTDAAFIEPQSSVDATAKRIVDALEAQHTRLLKRERRDRTMLGWIFLLPAALLFFAAHTRFVRYLLLLAAFAHLPLEAGVFDTLRLHRAYEAYARGDYNTTERLLKHVRTPSLQRAYLRASLLYRQEKYLRAAKAFEAIRTRDASQKSALLYNAATAYAKAGRYRRARILYRRALQLREDEDARHNLSVVLFSQETAAPKGRTKPGGENATPPGSSDADASPQSNRNDATAQSGGGGGHSRAKGASAKRHTPPKNATHPMPLSSKVYELINKGYIRETQPW